MVTSLVSLAVEKPDVPSDLYMAGLVGPDLEN